MKYLDERYEETRDQLKGIVTEIQIKNKCISLDFDDDKFYEWVKSLTQQDKRVAGLKDFEWNDTVTK